jgi:hypothetical protein
MSTKSPQEMQKIVQGGMVVWINTRAEKSIPDSKGIGYPLDRRNDHDRNLMAQARPDRYKEKPITLEDRRDYELYSFNQNKDSSIETFVYGADSPEGVVMRMDYNDVGELIYEASIPLTSIYPSNTSRSYAGKSLAIGFDIQGLPPGTETPRGEGGGPAIGVGGGVGLALTAAVVVLGCRSERAHLEAEKERTNNCSKKHRFGRSWTWPDDSGKGAISKAGLFIA